MIYRGKKRKIQMFSSFQYSINIIYKWAAEILSLGNVKKHLDTEKYRIDSILWFFC